MNKTYYFIKRNENMERITLIEDPQNINRFNVGDTTDINKKGIAVYETTERVQQLLDEKQTSLLDVHNYVTDRIRKETARIIKY